jgi:hypothetical protein
VSLGRDPLIVFPFDAPWHCEGFLDKRPTLGF